MADGKVWIALVRCPHGFQALMVGEERGNGTRITDGKCCGTWTDVVGWNVPADRVREALNEYAADIDAELLDAERSSAAEAATVLLTALGYKSGGLAAAAIEIVAQRDAARAENARLLQRILEVITEGAKDMIRIICRDVDMSAAHVGGPAHERLHTFFVSCPEVEAWLRERKSFVTRAAVGVEVLPKPKHAMYSVSYPCGCSASGPEPPPNYCPEHDVVPNPGEAAKRDAYYRTQTGAF